ncbi:MAG: hypothetical protein ACT4PE_05450 [Candidatus Eiseniibacteriota bacterium]
MESNVKHTPGWSVRPGLANTIRDGAGSLVAELPSHWPLDDPRGLMIAAAPELLAALRETVDDLEAAYDNGEGARPTAVSSVIHRARAAIDKAEGGAS